MKNLFMNVTKNNFDEFLRITHRLNTKTSKLSDNEATELNSKFKYLKLYFLNKEITHNQISDKCETIINNLAHFKETVEKLASVYHRTGLSKSQSLGNGGYELFKRLARDVSYLICSENNGGFGYNDLKITEVESDMVSYESVINFLNTEITILSQYDFENFYSFVMYYRDLENRLISSFNL